MNPAHNRIPDEDSRQESELKIELNDAVLKQWNLQAGTPLRKSKERARTLEDLEILIHPHRAPAFDYIPRRISDHIEAICGGKQDASIETLVNALVARDGFVRIADLMGGLSIWQRELARLPSVKKSLVQFVSVDLFNWELHGAEASISRTKVELGENIFDESYRPRLIVADVHNQVFKEDEKVTLTVVMEGMQYLHDKIGALAAWYNQASDGGIILVGGSKWSEWLSIEGTNEPAFPSVAKALEAAGITIITQGANCQVSGLSQKITENPFEDPNVVLIERKPNTWIYPNIKLVDIWENPHGYIRSYYKLNSDTEPALIVKEHSI